MVNGKTDDSGLIIPAPITPSTSQAPALACHRFYAPVVFPEADRLDARKVTVTPRMGNFPCIGDKCTLWNPERAECWDVTARRGQALAGEYAFNKMNDVHIEGAGS